TAGRRVTGSVVARRGHDVAGRRVDLHVAAADVDVEHQSAVVLFEVDLVEGAGRGALCGRDRLLLGDRGLREQRRAVVEAGGLGGRAMAGGDRVVTAAGHGHARGGAGGRGGCGEDCELGTHGGNRDK